MLFKRFLSSFKPNKTYSIQNRLSLSYSYPATNALQIVKPALPPQKIENNALQARQTFFPSCNVKQTIASSMENLKRVCNYAPLKEVLENFLNNLHQHSEYNLEDLFVPSEKDTYRFKDLLYGWFGIKNDKHMTNSDLLAELKKQSIELQFDDNEVTHLKNYLIYYLTRAYQHVERTTPYLVNAIDLHLKKIRECHSFDSLQTLFENTRDLSGKHSIKKMLYDYSNIPIQTEILQAKSWSEIYALIKEDMKPEIPLGIYMQ